jgi:CDP-paratose 2-epimerase
LRQSCIYGTRQFGVEDQGWVAWFIIASLLEKPITIYGDGKQIRDILWVDELIDAYVRLYHHAERVQGEVFNIGGGPENTLSLLELVEILKNEGAMVEDPAYSVWRPGDQKVYVSKVKKMHDAVGWKPVTGPEIGVRKLVEWAKENRGVLKKVLG